MVQCAQRRTSHEVRGLKLTKAELQSIPVDNVVLLTKYEDWNIIHLFTKSCFCCSRTSHEVRGLKLIDDPIKDRMEAGRTSHEVRGLKSDDVAVKMAELYVVLLTKYEDWNRGTKWAGYTPRCRTSHEVRGLKFCVDYAPTVEERSRTSHEVRGLK